MVLTGRFAQFLNNKKIPGVDAILGTGQLDRLPDVLRNRSLSVGTPARGASPAGYHDSKTPRPLCEGQLSACMCVFPKAAITGARFALSPNCEARFSRPPADILEEARDLVGRGVRELVLISQDTTDYGSDRRGRGWFPW